MEWKIRLVFHWAREQHWGARRYGSITDGAWRKRWPTLTEDRAKKWAPEAGVSVHPLLEMGTVALRREGRAKVARLLVAKDQKQLQRVGLSVTDFLPVKVTCAQLPGIRLREIRSAQRQNVGLPLKGEVHGEWEEIPLSKARDLVGKKP